MTKRDRRFWLARAAGLALAALMAAATAYAASAPAGPNITVYRSPT